MDEFWDTRTELNEDELFVTQIVSGDNNEILEFPNEHLGSGAQC